MVGYLYVTFQTKRLMAATVKMAKFIIESPQPTNLAGLNSYISEKLRRGRMFHFQNNM